MSITNKILTILEENQGESISGETLAETLGVSRSAVWKSIKSLRQEGHEIQAITNKGYCLSSQSDMISAEGIQKYLSDDLKKLPLYVHKTIDSTNEEAKRMALDKEPHGTTILARHQSQGKGRLGRTFISPANTGIYISILLKPNFDIRHAVLTTTAASVAVVRAIKKVCHENAQIKWVNDIYLNQKKVCGILTEAITDFETGQIQYLILGIGINCDTHDFDSDLIKIAGALPKGFSKNHLAAEVIGQTLNLMDHIEDRYFIKEYKESSLILGEKITVHKGGYKEGIPGVPAIATDIDENGCLEIVYDNGETETLNSGEISIRLQGSEK
ncbi:MAG: biotin--[acetyl-CoA-carboxylase] ligase [Anaerovoracaceae bacterium]